MVARVAFRVQAGDDAALAVGAPDVDDVRNGQVRVAQAFQQCADAVQTRAPIGWRARAATCRAAKPPWRRRRRASRPFRSRRSRSSRRADPPPPRKRYSWDDEPEPAEDPDAHVLEPPSPEEVPVIWQRPLRVRGVVVPFRRNGGGGMDDSVT